MRESNYKSIQVSDRLSLNDAIKVAKELDKPYLKGHVIIRDALTGDILEEKDNLIMLRGRAYVLELLFGMNAPESTGYNNDHTRKVCLFGIGQGGADLLASPLEAIAPKFNDKDLYSPIPFVIETDLKEVIPEHQANPSIYDNLDSEQRGIYYLPKTQPDGSIRYYGKVFEKDTARLKINTDTNECYWQGTLRITPNEARGYVFNELGLYLANYNQSSNTYSNVELFSHICVSSIALTSLKRGVLISYILYA